MLCDFLQRGRVKEIDGALEYRTDSHKTNGLSVGGKVALENIAHTHGRW